MSNKLLSLNSKVLCFMPLALVAGPLISEIFIIISILIIGYDIFKKKKFNYFNNIYFKFFLAFWLYLILSNLINFYNLKEFIKIVFYIRFGLWVIVIVYTIHEYKDFLKEFSFYLSFVILLLLFDGYFQYINGFNLLGLEIEDQRLSSLFGDEKILGTYLSRLILLLIGLKILLRESNYKFQIAFYFLTADILIFLSGDRAPFFLINLSSIYLIFMCKELKLLRSTILIVSIFLITIISLTDN